jgi:hypothetical protein
MLFLQECDRAKHVFSLARALSTIFFSTIVALTGRGGGWGYFRLFFQYVLYNHGFS